MQLQRIYTIYVLACRGERFYVGRTKKRNLQRRLDAHTNGLGSAFTREFPPTQREPVAIYEQCLAFDETMYTKIWMAQYGIDNVRGGPYSQRELPLATRRFLEMEIKHDENRCLRCGKQGHYVKSCTEQLHPITEDAAPIVTSKYFDHTPDTNTDSGEVTEAQLEALRDKVRRHLAGNWGDALRSGVQLSSCRRKQYGDEEVIYIDTDQRWCPNVGREHRNSRLYVQVHSKWGLRVRCHSRHCTEWRTKTAVPLGAVLRSVLFGK
jgi:predicted GIY-YIG superfamily endonuclease